MIGLILAAGAGTRLGPLTAGRPKCLVEVAGRTILDRQIESLAARGVGRVVVATGFAHELVHRHIEQTWGDREIELVFNDRFAETNYIYSLWVARRNVRGAVILLHGDLVYDAGVLATLLAAECDSGVLVRPHGPLPEKDFKAEVVDGRVRRIGVEVAGDNAVFCAPFYKLSPAVFARWMESIEPYVNENNLDGYAEQALNGILADLDLRAVPCDGFCMEIDTPADLREAEAHYRREGTENA
jgi:phosphoenolpyruvate phosphomutase